MKRVFFAIALLLSSPALAENTTCKNHEDICQQMIDKSNEAIKEHPKKTASNSNNDNKHVKDMKKRCKAKYGNDFRMRRYCIEQQKKGANKFIDILNQYEKNDEMQNAFADCIDKYTDQHGMNYRMIAYCADKQADAYEKLK